MTQTQNANEGAAYAAKVARQVGDVAEPVPATKSAVGFTPGRWRASSMTMDRKEWALLNGKGGIQIVQRGEDVIAAVWCGDDRDGEEQANARLIAAAPELYEALSDLVSDPLRYNDNRIEIDCASHAAAMGRVLRARAALSKARGE